MSVVKDVKNKYVKEIKEELEKLLNEYKNNNPISNTDYIHRTGIIAGLEKAIKLIKEYE